MDLQVNYKNPKFYKTAKYPIRQPIYLTWLICYPTRENVVTKLAFATEEIFEMHMEGKRKALPARSK